MGITVERPPADEKSFTEIMDACLVGLREFAIVPPDIQKASEQGYITLSEGLGFVARDEDGRIAGVLGMFVSDFWYSHEPILLNRIGPYVLPKYRFGIVGVKLMRAVRDLADDRDMLAFIWNQNKRQSTQASLFAQVSGYIPLGHVIAIRKHKARMTEAA